MPAMKVSATATPRRHCISALSTELSALSSGRDVDAVKDTVASVIELTYDAVEFN